MHKEAKIREGAHSAECACQAPPASSVTQQLSSNLDVQIPARLKALRTKLGLSAATLDRQAHFAPGTTGRLERRDQRIYATHLYRIATIMGVDISYFYTTTDEAIPQGTSPQDTEKQRLLEAYMRITDPTLKRDVFELVETLAGNDAPNPPKS